MPNLPLPLPNQGVVREAAVDELMVPENTVQEAVNLHFDRIGAVTLRKGLTLLGSQIGNNTNVLGIGNYRNNAGTTYRALAMVGTGVYAYAGSWSLVRSGLTSGSKARFANFIDLTYMVNGNGNQAVATYDGSSFGSSNIGSLPSGDFIEQYRSRVWVGDSATDKLYYSDVVSTKLANL